jgi:hypothetical protein
MIFLSSDPRSVAELAKALAETAAELELAQAA